MSDIPTYEVHPETPTHRSRPSVITNASALAESTMSFGSIMSADGLARLSQFPIPPAQLPMSLSQQSSPVESTGSMSPTTTARRALPIPPSPPTAPLNIQKRFPHQAVPLVPPLPPIPPALAALRQTVNTSVGPSHPVPSSVPPLSSTASTISSHPYPSPYDWHDGSSSIAADPYGEATLPTNFITSLISSVAAQDGESTNLPSPTLLKRGPGYYADSVISNAMTTESTITYPPPQMFPSPALPAQFTSKAALQHRAARSVDVTGSYVADQIRTPERVHPHLGGRTTPETYTSDQLSGTTTGKDTVTSQLRTMSASPSIQSMNSTTPLMQSFPRGDPILEEDEPAKSSNPSTPGKGSRDSRQRRASVAYSNKTSKSYVSSLRARISHSTGGSDSRKSLKQIGMFRKKPLPPVPPLPDAQDIRRAEDALPLPDLVNRAQVLSALLDKGHRPYHSMQSVPAELKGQDGNQGEGVVIYSGTDPVLYHARGRKGQSGEMVDGAWDAEQPDTPSKRHGFALLYLSGKQRLWIFVVLGVIIVGIVVGVAAGVTVSKRSTHTCPGNFTGAACNLDATCVCTSTVPGQCHALAQSLVELVPSLNTIFDANFTAASLSTAVWEAQGQPNGPNCADQANLIDVAPSLTPASAPNRTMWAQSALLWNFVMSEDLDAASKLQTFVRDAPWSSLNPSDGPVSDPEGRFSIQLLGFDFDFASQTVTPPSATFRNAGQPSQAQINRVNDVAEAALDRMYTFATASSTQQQTALLHYWTDVLQQQPSDLNTFLSLVRGSPVLLPFDSLSPSDHPLSNLLTNSSTDPFPPPLACFPELSSSQLDIINSVETNIFGLSAASAASSFDDSCYPSRPIYGVLDILQLRTPFPDSRTGVAKQAAVLTREASSRVVVYSGEVLSALPGSNSSNTVVTDPRQYGTLNNINHVLLRYLSSISDVNVAIELVRYVLSSPAGPPSSTLPLFSAISSLPVMEVAVFGSVSASDIQYTVSSLSDPTGGLYFGTTAALNLRYWTVNAVQKPLIWAELATSPLVVRDGSFTNGDFNQIWDSAYNYFHSVNNAIVTVSNVTNGFNAVGLLKP